MTDMGPSDARLQIDDLWSRVATLTRDFDAVLVERDAARADAEKWETRANEMGNKFSAAEALVATASATGQGLGRCPECNPRRVTDTDGDVWESKGNGYWRCLTTASCDVAGADLVNVCGPLTELTPPFQPVTGEKP